MVFGMATDFPLALAFGIQYAPGARADLSDTNADSHGSESDQNNVDTFRLSVMLAIDVTLLRL